MTYQNNDIPMFDLYFLSNILACNIYVSIEELVICTLILLRVKYYFTCN